MFPRPKDTTAKQTPITIKPNISGTNDSGARSVIVVPSRINRPEDGDLKDVEETEIAAQITVAEEGGWGWVILVAAFTSICLMDGVIYTFGAVFNEITEELQLDQSLIGLINSIGISIYFGFAPLASALINRFGFRAVHMFGAVISSFSLICTYFVKNYGAIFLFYGVLTGFGFCLVNMASSLVAGFYFEKLRSITLAIASSGSSVGIMVMFPINAFLVELAGWRTLTLFHSGLVGITYFLGMTYIPLLSMTVTKTTDESTRTVTYLPNVSTPALKKSLSRIKPEGDRIEPTATEKLFSAVSNYNFPTAAAIVDDGKLNIGNTGVPGPSTLPTSRLTLTAHAPKGGLSQRQLKQVQSMISRTSVQDKTKINIELQTAVDEPKKKVSIWKRLFHWEQHIPESRPMYRDDVFFKGNLEKLPAYQKSKMDVSPEQKTGLEYQLAVTRAVTTVELQEKKGVFTTAARRILATMLDPVLLKRHSFLLMGFSAFIEYLGLLVPYIFIQERNTNAGVAEEHGAFFVSAIGFSNALGRFSLGVLASKLDPLNIFIFCNLLAGVAVVVSNLSYNVYFQYLCCLIFGFCVADVASVRSMVFVQLYGLEKLTNATGIMYLTQGIACGISTPMASMVKTTFGLAATFYLAGIYLFLSGICLLPVKGFYKKEKLKEQEITTPIGPQNRPAPGPVPLKSN